MLAKMPRPSRTARTIVAKLSSARIIFAASFVTSVPVMPMATPMSALLRAGASFTPSPVIATMFPSACRPSTICSLCSGATRAYTERDRTISRAPASPAASSSIPVTAPSRGGMMPSSAAMRAAVRGWSPVIITTRMPAACASAMAVRASGRGGSMNPDDAGENEVALDLLARLAVRRPGQRTVGHAERAEGVAGEPVDRGQHLTAPLVDERPRPLAHPLVGAAGEQDVGSALDHDRDAVGAGGVDLHGAHQLALRRERHLGHPAEPAAPLVVQPGLAPGDQERGLGRVALDGPLAVPFVQ